MTSKQALLRMILSTTIGGILLTALLFGAAGRLDWFAGWVETVLWFGLKYIYGALLYKINPDLLVERAQSHREETPRWEKIIIRLYFVFAFAFFPVAGYQAGRMGTMNSVPLWLLGVSWVGYIILSLLPAWATLSNPFHSSASRLQTDREQSVVSTGPYQYVRHPTYIAAILLWLWTPLMLESSWALIPGALAGLMMGLRTHFEDQMLRENLEGYAEYAQQVKYRLIPGIY